VAMNSFSFCLLRKIFISPSILKDSFAGYINLGFYLFSFRLWNISIHVLLAFRVSLEKSVVILIGLPLYVTCHFFLAACIILSLFCVFSVLTIIYLRVFLLLLCLFDVLIDSYICISLFLFLKISEDFCYFFLMFCMPLACTSSPSIPILIHWFGL
jgi:hypothetical protein